MSHIDNTINFDLLLNRKSRYPDELSYVYSDINFYKEFIINNEDYEVGVLKLKLTISRKFTLEYLCDNKEKLLNAIMSEESELNKINNKLKDNNIGFMFYITEDSLINFNNFIDEKVFEYKTMNSSLIDYMNNKCIKTIFAQYLSNNSNNYINKNTNYLTQKKYFYDTSKNKNSYINKKNKKNNYISYENQEMLKRKKIVNLNDIFPKIAIRIIGEEFPLNESLLNEYMHLFKELKIKPYMTSFFWNMSDIGLMNNIGLEKFGTSHVEYISLLKEFILKTKIIQQEKKEAEYKIKKKI